MKKVIEAKLEELKNALLKRDYDACQLSAELRGLEKGVKRNIVDILSEAELKTFYTDCWLKGIVSGASHIRRYNLIKNYLDYFELTPSVENIGDVFCQYLNNGECTDYQIYLFYQGEKIKVIPLTNKAAKTLVDRYNNVTWSGVFVSPNSAKILVASCEKQIYLQNWNIRNFSVDLDSHF